MFCALRKDVRDIFVEGSKSRCDHFEKILTSLYPSTILVKFVGRLCRLPFSWRRRKGFADNTPKRLFKQEVVEEFGIARSRKIPTSMGV